VADRRRIDLGARKRLLDGDRSEPGRREILQAGV